MVITGSYGAISSPSCRACTSSSPQAGSKAPEEKRPAHSLTMATASSIPPSTESSFWKTCIVTWGWRPSASSSSFA